MKKIILPIKGSNEIYEIKATKIICLGLNYADHIAEDSVAHVAGTKTKGEPVLFPKFPNVLIGNGDDIVYHNILNEIKQDRVDYEGELAIIIKKAGKNIPKIKINDYILGYTCFNDVTARLMQKEDISNKRPWLKSKSLDTFGPIGPQIVKPEDIGNINNLTIETRLNGKIVQSGNTSQMIHKVDEIIEYVSKYFTLEPSDIIITGTPKGVGPMKIGDIIEVEIENIGVLKNQVV